MTNENVQFSILCTSEKNISRGAGPMAKRKKKRDEFNVPRETRLSGRCDYLGCTLVTSHQYVVENLMGNLLLKTECPDCSLSGCFLYMPYDWDHLNVLDAILLRLLIYPFHLLNIRHQVNDFPKSNRRQ